MKLFRNLFLAVILTLAFVVSANATTRTLQLNTAAAKLPVTYTEAPQVIKIVRIVDFSKITTTQTATTTTLIARIPAGLVVMAVGADVQTVAGAACTAKVGDWTVPAIAADTGLWESTAVDDDGYFTSLDINALGGSCSFNGTTTPAYGLGKYYSAQTDLYLVTSASTHVAKIKFTITCFKGY